ncbi:IclR family transcriptional regulator [Pseudoclavibacter endophyticus]|uniref:IclR family transcriptional regulator n=2 Tax=Pseudoclavibacter endophyticus TaxID=1778590 RepID=A0A6H9WNS9_9MICO|nr:IclR family transcriptional regulator [Pseudoclavibacter endophyticus]
MTACGRVLAVLEVFDEDHITLTLSEISRRAGLSLSTTHRLVGELHRWGALERGSDGRYAVGMRVLELGALEPQGLRLREAAKPYLGDLHAATGADVNLSVRDGTDVVYIDSIRARGGAPVLTRLGGRWPMHATATGHVLLAWAAPAFRERVLAGQLKRFTSTTITDPDELRRALARVRQAGAAIVENTITHGALAIAVPVRGTQDRPIAAVGVTVPSGSVLPHVLLPTLLAAANEISRALTGGRRQQRSA